MEITISFIYRTPEQAEGVARQLISWGKAPSQGFRIIKGDERYAIIWMDDKPFPKTMRMRTRRGKKS
jgi:hypothetical protein